MVYLLLADGDSEMLGALAPLLRRAGHDVATAIDGVDALDLLLGDTFDLCVLTHDLPGLSGHEVAGAFRESRGPTRFVLVPDLTHLMTGSGQAVDSWPDTTVLRLLEVVDELCGV